MKLSIVIPVYNVENYLAKCLESVIRPELSDYELIIVNDGSTDASLSVAESYAGKYPELIRLISTPNGGLGAARNVGIEAARGEYLLFLDSDDYLTDTAVGEMLAELDGEADMYIYDIRSVNEAGAEIKYDKGADLAGDTTLERSPELLSCLPSAVNKLCRRALFTETGIRFPGRVWYEDLRTMPKLYLHAKKIRYLPKLWYNYVQRSGSITNNKNIQRNLEIIDAVDELLEHYKLCGEFEHFKTELEFMAFYNQYLTSTTRVVHIDTKSPVLTALRDDYIKKFPDFEQNPRYKTMPKKWLLLSKLIKHRLYPAVAAVIKLNDIVKGKQ